MPTLSIPTPFRSYTEGTPNVYLQATNVGDAVQELTSKYPALESHLITEDGNLRPFVNLFVNDEDVRYLQGLDTELESQDRLQIIPSIAGGIRTPTYTVLLLEVCLISVESSMLSNAFCGDSPGELR